MFTVRKTVLNKNTFYREILKKSEEKKNCEIFLLNYLISVILIASIVM